MKSRSCNMGVSAQILLIAVVKCTDIGVGGASAFLIRPPNNLACNNNVLRNCIRDGAQKSNVPVSNMLSKQAPSSNGEMLQLQMNTGKNVEDESSDDTSNDADDDAPTLPLPSTTAQPPRQKKNIWQTIFDPIVTSPIVPFFLIWGPILQNPYNKRKWAELTANADPILVNAGLSAVVTIIISYFFYNARVEAAEEASERREVALQDLRTARQGQFSSNSSEPTSTEVVEAAASAYEDALRKEMHLRQIVPGWGWRLDFPDDPVSREEDKAAARQFLGLEITEDGNIVEFGG